jgi:hypothetical protein
MKNIIMFCVGFGLASVFFHHHRPSTIFEGEVAEAVRVAFPDKPIMVAIAYHESRNHQQDSRGYVYRGEENRHDVGVFQINEDYHAVDAARLGYDIYSLGGNIAYADFLSKEGLRHWKASYNKKDKRGRWDGWKYSPEWAAMSTREKKKAWGPIRNDEQEPVW